MITPSFGLTATERVLPRMALDFTTASLDSRVTFTRSGNTATVVNSSGNVVLINADLPRFNYNPLTLACNGLLVEESRINTFQYSEDFSNAFWIKSGMLAFGSGSTVNAIISPDGTQNADLLTEDTSTGSHLISTNLLFNFVSGTTYTQSYFVKSNGRSKFQTTYRSNWFGTSAINFDLVAKTAAVVGGSTATTSGTITEFANGWFRITHTATATATGNSPTDTFFYFSNATGVISYTGDGTSGAYVWGAQLEVGAFATSYIPNLSNSTTTRNPDVAVMTSTNFSSWYTATTGAAVVWAIPQTATGTRPLIQFDDTTADEIIALRGNVADPEMSIIDGGAPQAQIDAGTIVANTAYKLSGAWNTDSCAAAQNGSAAVTDNTATIPTPTQLRIGSDGTNYASALIQKILYYPQRIIDAEVQAFSK